MEMTYRQNGDYLIPDIRLSEQAEAPIGKYGQMRKQYLKEHRPILWNRMVLSEQLYPHLAEIDETAHRRLDELKMSGMPAKSSHRKKSTNDTIKNCDGVDKEEFQQRRRFK